MLKSEAINGVASALTLLLVIMWLITAVFCARALFLGQIMWPGKDEDKTMADMPWGWKGNKGDARASKVRPARLDDDV